MDWGLVSVLVGAVVSLIGALLGFLWSVTAWISKQFATNRELVYDKFEQLQKFITDKIEYHEKHDDERFDAVAKELTVMRSDISRDIWELRLRNAMVDGKTSELAKRTRLQNKLEEAPEDAH
jgi:hypothetical protein